MFFFFIVSESTQTLTKAAVICVLKRCYGGAKNSHFVQKNSCHLQMQCKKKKSNIKIHFFCKYRYLRFRSGLTQRPWLSSLVPLEWEDFLLLHPTATSIATYCWTQLWYLSSTTVGELIDVLFTCNYSNLIITWKTLCCWLLCETHRKFHSH